MKFLLSQRSVVAGERRENLSALLHAKLSDSEVIKYPVNVFVCFCYSLFVFVS